MKFKAHVAGFVELIRPLYTATTKSVMDNYANSGTITFVLNANSLEMIVDCGFINAKNTINVDDNIINLSIEKHGTTTVNVTDLMNALQSFTDCVSVTLEDSDNANEFIITNTDDKQEFQSLPKEQVVNKYEFDVSKQKKSHVRMNKKIFHTYVKKIAVAFSQQSYHKQYNYWVMRTCKNNELRFTAGTGSFFAVVDINNLGANLVSAKGDILFPIKQTPAVLDILDKSQAEMLDITLHDDFIFLVCGNLQLRLLTDTSIQYPNEAKLLEVDSAYKFTTQAAKWQNAILGINATFDDNFRRQNRMHLCKLEIDTESKVIHAQTTETVAKSHRKIPMNEVATDAETKTINFTSCSKYFHDAIKIASNAEYLQFELSGEDDIMKIRYYAGEFVGDHLSFMKTDSLGVNERMTVFFGPAK